MSLSMSNISMLILLVLMSISLWAYGVNIGDKCSANSVMGEYKFLKDCPEIAYYLKKLGVNRTEGKVCCLSTPKPLPWTIEINGSSIPYNPNIAGSLAQAMCVYNAKTYDSEKSVLNDLEHVSQCAQKEAHIAFIGFWNNSDFVWQCSGNLISAKIVLTLARCTLSEFGDVEFVKVGNVLWEEKMKQIIKIDKIIRHPEYEVENKHHDVAILRLIHNVVYNKWTKPVCLPVNWSNVDKKFIGMGWNENKDFHHTFYSTVYAECELFHDNKSQMCLRFKGVLDSYCQPNNDGLFLVFKQDRKCVNDVLQLDLYDHVCNIIPILYVQVHHFISWIEKNAWPEFF